MSRRIWQGAAAVFGALELHTRGYGRGVLGGIRVFHKVEALKKTRVHLEVVDE